MKKSIRLTESDLHTIIKNCVNEALAHKKANINETRVIYGYEGNPIGEETDDGKINWYYSDGQAGGTDGGHYMGTDEFLRYNGLMNDIYDDEEWY